MAARAILHIDMDAFYAAIEQRDRPETRGRAVVVGADPRGRGVVSAASYEARRFGIHSAMPIGKAYRLCAHAVFLPVDMAKYARVSRDLMRILREYTPLVEPLSLDEAFLDVTESRQLFGAPREIACRIKAQIREELSLGASAGIAPNKFLAKIASDLDKPDGLVEVLPGTENAFLSELPIARLWGVGPAAERSLAGLGVRTIGQLGRLSRIMLVARMGAAGAHLWRLARGEDDRPVVPWDEPKSVGAEETFGRDTQDPERLRATLLSQAERVAAELRAQGLRGRSVTLKLRFADFRTLTRQETVVAPTADGGEIFRRAWAALLRVERTQAIRLVGVSVSRLSDEQDPQQLSLFAKADAGERVGRVADEIRSRFGPGSVVRASLLTRRASARSRLAPDGPRAGD